MRNFIILLVAVMAIIITGCSSLSETPSSPSNESLEGVQASSWGAYTMEIDLENNTITSIPDRDAMMHFNLNGYLGLCDGGCFRFWIDSITGTVLEITMEFENPVKLTGYDVRIIFTNLYSKTVLNPDSYTDLFDPPSTPEQINPFIAFHKEDPTRIFPDSPFSDTEHLSLDFPPGAPSAVSYVINASYPDNCGEPYEINSMMFTGELTPTGGNGTVSCVVLDHQNDISYVHVDSTPITGSWTIMNPVGGDVWECDITNSMGAPIGDYMLLIKAESLNPLQASTYNYVTVTVEDSSQDPCDGAMNFFFASDGNWQVNATIDEASNRQFLTNLLDYTPTGPAINNNTIYYYGGRGGSFHNGAFSDLRTLAEGFGYTWREQETGALNLNDVRVMFWPGFGYGDTSDPPTDEEIQALKDLLAIDGRVIVMSDYTLSPTGNAWINDQMIRLGSSIRKMDGGEGTNQALIPQDCPAFTQNVDSVYFRAWGYLYTDGDAFTLFYDNNDLTKSVMMGEVLDEI